MNSLWYNLLHVIPVMSFAFPTFVPAFGNPGRAFDIVPHVAYRVEYRGMVTEFNSSYDVARYINAQPGAVVCWDHICQHVEIPVN